MNNAETLEQRRSRFYSDVVTKLAEYNQGGSETSEVLREIFHYSSLCLGEKIDPVERLSDEQQAELADDLIQALPTMDDRLDDPGTMEYYPTNEDIRRCTHSGRQYLLENFAPKLNIPNEKREILKKLLEDLSKQNTYDELEYMVLGIGRPQHEYYDPPTLDLRGVPETHVWFNDWERKESKRVYGE